MRDDTAVILDIDGTLVDNTYFHTIAWWRACRDFGIRLDMATPHRLIGMGGDQLTIQIAGEKRDDLIKAHSEHVKVFFDEMRPCDGASELLVALHQRGVRILIATSAGEESLERLLDIIKHRDLIEHVTAGDDVERTKPAPDLFAKALEHFGGPPDRARAIGDTGWDAQSAGRSGIDCVGVRTGGWNDAELLAAGCVEVRRDAREIVNTLDDGALASLLAQR